MSATSLDRVRWSIGAVVLAGVVLVTVLLAGGGSPQPVPQGLPDAGPLTGWGLPVVRLVADLAGLATLGLLLAAGILLPSPARMLVRPAFEATRAAVRGALVWAVAVVIEQWLTLSDLLGISAGRALDPALLRSFVTQTPQGRALLVQLVLVLVAAGVARSSLTTSRAAVGTLLAAVALVPPTLTGHSASSGSHELAVASLMVHVLAASLWVGGLLSLLWLVARPPRHAEDTAFGPALARFSALAGGCWVVVAVSGVVNAGVRLGGFAPLATSAYGVLVLCKALALVVLGGFGWWHRRRTVARGGAMSWPTPALFLRVAAAEMVVMGATVALAVGLSRTPTPNSDELDANPATDLLGFQLPPAPDVGHLVTGFVADGFAITFLLAAAVAYGAGVFTLRRRGDRWPVGRVLAWYAGLLVAAWSLVGGLGLYSHVMFSAHMVAHMMLSMVAPIGLVLGAPITLALRTLPGRRVPKEQGLRQLLQSVLHSRLVRLLSHPLVAAGLFVASLYALYFTRLFGALMGNHLGHVLMEAHFLAVGSLFFWVLIGVDPTPRVLHPLARVGLLLVVMPFHAFFAIALMNTDTVLAPSYYAALHRPYSTDLVADQHLGGAISWALGEVPIVLVMAAIFVQWFRADSREARRHDRRHERAAQGEDELSSYNAYLARLAGQAEPTQAERTPAERTPGDGDEQSH